MDNFFVLFWLRYNIKLDEIIEKILSLKNTQEKKFEKNRPFCIFFELKDGKFLIQS